MKFCEWQLHGCYYTNSRTSESLPKEDFEILRDAEVTELARQIVVIASGVAIDYVPPDLPVVVRIKALLEGFLEGAT